MEIPGYIIQREIGAGGMATVYLAVHEALEREVALKVMTPSLASDETYCRRFLKEGKIAAKLNHRHVLTVFDIGQHEDHFYIASEYVPDGTLRERIDAGISETDAVRVLEELTQGLSYAHAHGFVHRDVKPANVLFREDGTCVLGDFGIAKSVNSDTFATKLGTSLGTPYYMSPEQARGEKVDNRTDLYSLGVVLYECLTGKPPFDADDPFTVALMQINEPVPVLPDKYSRYQPLIEKLLAKEPQNRFVDAEEFLKHLHRVTGRDDPGGGALGGFKLPNWWPMVAAGLVLAAALAVALSQWRPSAGEADRSVSAGSSTAENDVEDAPTEEPPPNDGSKEIAQPTESDQVAEKLAEAQTLVSQRRLVPPTQPNAWTVLREAEAIEPDNRSIEIALREVANTVESRAEELWRGGDRDAARGLVCSGLSSFPDRQGLSYLAEQFDADCEDSRIAVQPADDDRPSGEGPDAAETPESARVRDLLATADSYMEQDILAFPAGENAMDKYLAVKAIDPDNERAKQQLAVIAEIWADSAVYVVQRGRNDSALNTVVLGLRADATNRRLLSLKSRLK